MCFTSGETGCDQPDPLSTGAISSYISEYSMFAAVGSRIKLAEEQIESDD